MKPLHLAVLIVVSGLVGWWFFGHEESLEIHPDGDLLRVDRPEEAPSAARPPPGASPRGDVRAEGSAQVDLPTRPRRNPRLPLSGRMLERATWSDEAAMDVLLEIADAVGKPLRVRPSAQRRLEQIRVTMDRGRSEVPAVLDAILKKEYLEWTVRRGALEIFSDDG